MIFASSPRDWKEARPDPSEIIKFKKLREELGIDPVYFHATYLINLADEGEIGAKSKKLLISELKLASEMGVVGSIVHVGSFKEDKKLPPELLMHRHEILQRNIMEVLDATPKDTLFIVENAGTRKIGQKLDEIGMITKWDPRLRVCLDTCHLHAAGYDLSDPEKLDLFLKTFDVVVGLEKLELIHINDSRDEFGSLRDRHENIGEGKVGMEVFRLLLNHSKTKSLPFIAEVPGFEGAGPDRKNLEILKNLVV